MAQADPDDSSTYQLTLTHTRFTCFCTPVDALGGLCDNISDDTTRSFPRIEAWAHCQGFLIPALNLIQTEGRGFWGNIILTGYIVARAVPLASVTGIVYDITRARVIPPELGRGLMCLKVVIVMGAIALVSLRGHEPSHQYRERETGEDTAEIHRGVRSP